MTTRLVKGQNLSWPGRLVRVEVHGHPCDVSALLVGEDDLVRGSDDLVFYNQPSAPGVTWTAGTPQRLDVDPARLTSPRVRCLVSVDPDAPEMGRLPTLRAVLSDENGSPVAEFELTGLTTERAVVVCEVYQRAGAWKVRAVSQGYDGGLAEAVTRHGVEVDDPAPVAAPAPPAPSSTPQGTPAPRVGPPPPGTSDQERLYSHVGRIIEDAARTTSSLRSTVEYAEKRRDTALSAHLDDPRLRSGPAAQAAQGAEQRRHDDLVATATASHRRDVDQLAGEVWQLESTLPASMAHWSSSVWHPWRAPDVVSVAVRAGDLHVPEAPDLRLPLLQHVYSSRPLWVDTTDDDGSAARFLRTLVTRYVSAYPAGALALAVVDLAGTAGPLLAPLGGPGCQVLTRGRATTTAAATELLDDVIRHIDLVQMARQAGALDSLVGDDARDTLLVLPDLPHGYDDGVLARVRYVLDEGPAGGTRLLMSGDVAEAVAHGPLVTALLRETLRLPVRTDDHLTDAWTGTGWTFTPDLGPDDGAAIDQVLLRASAGGQHP